MKFDFEFFELFLYLILGVAVLLYVVFFRKRISFLLAPDYVIDSSKKWVILTIGNFLPSFFGAGFATAHIRELFYDSKYAEYENYALIAGFVILVLLFILSGLITDRVLYHNNRAYKDWKDYTFKK